MDGITTGGTVSALRSPQAVGGTGGRCDRAAMADSPIRLDAVTVRRRRR